MAPDRFDGERIPAIEGPGGKLGIDTLIAEVDGGKIPGSFTQDDATGSAQVGSQMNFDGLQ